jgi:hypothetical protein
VPDLEPTSGFDVVRPETRFPVVESAQLEPLQHRMLRHARRRIDDLPQLAGGSVFVFQTNDRYAIAPEGPRMLGSDVVVKATMVAVVLTRAQEVHVVATLSPGTSGARLAMRASFNCRVIDPVRVLENGCWDVRSDLRAYLLDDSKLLMLGARDDVLRNDDVVRRILARTFARKKLEPPLIPGMTVQLIDVSLSLQGGVPGPRRSPEEADYGASGRDAFEDFSGDGRPRDRYGS